MKNDALHLLLIEDNPADAALITYELRRSGLEHELRCVVRKADFLREMRKEPLDAILSDFSMPEFNALDALSAVQSDGVDVPFILVTGSQSEEVAVECIKRGVDDYILKSSLKRLPSALLSSIQKRRAEKNKDEAEDRIREQAALLNKARDAIIVMDLKGAIGFWNQSAERLYGWTAEEIIGKEYAALLCAADQSQYDAALADVLRADEWHGELKQTTRTE